MNKKYLFVLFAFLGVVLFGCQSLFATNVDDTPAPTAVPLPTESQTQVPTAVPPERESTDTPEPALTAEPLETEAPETEEPASPDGTGQPTRVVSPPGTINMPEGFGLSVFAEGLNDPRMMTVGPDGIVYVAERGAGRIVRLPDRDEDGVADGVEIVASGLSAPSSLDFYTDGSLYVGETTRVVRLFSPTEEGRFQEQEIIVDGLPRGGHNTRTVRFSPDGAYLYVSVGSSCNVCIEDDERRATIMRYRPDGSEAMIYAEGFRNAVGITFRPGTDELWATNNGRDWLGDDQPPETIYRVTEGENAGWPYCHAGRILDPDYGEEGACEGISDPEVEMQAHTAPLGLTFYTGSQFPEEYQGDMFVGLHGSWNRTVPVGYKVVRVPMENGEVGEVRDFATGWLRDDGSKWGRPVDVVTASDGSLLISDDGEGRIYRAFFHGEL
jgi:glucose/arabinose dehydrogenase